MDPSPSLQAAQQLHQTALKRLRRSPSTLKQYRIYIGGYVRFIEERGGPMDLEHALTPDLVSDYQDSVRATSMGTRDGASAERDSVRLVKTFSRWLWRRGFVANDPLARLEPPRLAKLHRLPYTEAEARRLLVAARSGPRPIFARALLLLGLDTGCRIGELCAADLGDLDLGAGAILFRHTKNGHPRRVIFQGPSLEALRAWLEARVAVGGEQALFTSAAGDRLTYGEAYRLYARLGKAAGVPNCIPHRGRHTHASELIAELPGAELQLRHRLGHMSHQVLADYVSVTERSAREIAAVASLSSKWNL